MIYEMFSKGSLFYDYWLVCFSLCLIRLEQTWNITEQNDAPKHKSSANPMGQAERVLEIPDGEKKAEKFPEKSR